MAKLAEEEDRKLQKVWNLIVLFWLIITTTKLLYSEDLVNRTVTEIMESCTQCH